MTERGGRRVKRNGSRKRPRDYAALAEAREEREDIVHDVEDSLASDVMFPGACCARCLT